MAERSERYLEIRTKLNNVALDVFADILAVRIRRGALNLSPLLPERRTSLLENLRRFIEAIRADAEFHGDQDALDRIARIGMDPELERTFGGTDTGRREEENRSVRPHNILHGAGMRR